MSAPGRKRKVCVGWGGRCFACGGRGDLGLSQRRSKGSLETVRSCPVCRGCGRARVVGLGDGR